METQSKPFLLDHKVETATSKLITASRLQKDRIGKQIFPFHRVGRNCYYSLDEIYGVIERSKCGGKAA
jgi:hypothetical protein